MKSWRLGEGISFSNMDPLMHKIFLKWLKRYLRVTPAEIKYEIYIHQTSVDRTRLTREYWAGVMNIPSSEFRVYLKRNNLSSTRKNIGKNYFGLLRISVKKSSGLSYKIAEWIKEVSNHYCRVV